MSHKIAFVFPGQGSQSVGMLKGLAEKYSCIRDTFNEASSVLDYDLWELVQNGPSAKLDQTEITQPAVLVADIAVYRTFQSTQPEWLAGHSLGEYAALVVAESLDFKDAIQLVAYRGLCMQEAVPKGVGAMAAIIGLDDQTLEKICKEQARACVLAPANFNSIGQTVIAGNLEAVQRAIDCAKAAGAKIAKLIPVSVPSHCMLMMPAAERFANYLKAININSPKIPVLQNVDVESHNDPEKIRECLVQQLVSPVRWVETIKKMQAKGVEEIIECGPGKVLAGLIKRIDRGLTIRLGDN
jgi:[acyl-carrier-protein] S-malonyltransferase